MAMPSKKIPAILAVILLAATMPAFGEVQTVNTDKEIYYKNDQIIFSGSVNDEDSGLVSIVIRDSNDKFVMLKQAFIKPDNTFELTINTNSKFSTEGQYNVTSFIANMTEGAITKFNYYFKSESVVQPTSEQELEPVQEENTKEEKDNENIPITPQQTEPTQKIPGFPDPNKSPQYYIDRYNNEPIYKEWFDRNFPGSTIYQIVGVPITETIIVESTTNEETELIVNSLEETTKSFHNEDKNADEKVISTNDSTMISQTSAIDTSGEETSAVFFALGGLGVLFGAVYGIKKKTENGIKRPKPKKEWFKKNIINFKTCNEPSNIIRSRLANGEISIDEFYSIRDALEKTSKTD